VPASTSPAMRSKVLRSMRRKVSESPGARKNGLGAALVEHPERRPADQVPAARALERVDGGHVHGDGDGRARHTHARLAAPRQIEARIEAGDIG